MRTETITWHELPADRLPDDDTTVQLELQELERPELGTEVWPGYLAAGTWIDAASGHPIDAARVVAWSDMPAGSRAC